MTKYCNKYCNAGENVLLHRQKGVIDHRNIRHSLRNSPPDCFCQMLRIWSLVSQVQILQINKKRKQDILAAPPAEMRNRAQKYKALAAKQSPGLFLPNATHLEPRVASSNLVNKQKRKQDILKNVLLPFGRGDKIIGVKFGLAAGFSSFCTATVLQRRYCCKGALLFFISVQHFSAEHSG